MCCKLQYNGTESLYNEELESNGARYSILEVFVGTILLEACFSFYWRQILQLDIYDPEILSTPESSKLTDLKIGGIQKTGRYIGLSKEYYTDVT